jgi:hypothetical protein
MNARTERMMNSENLGTGITENGALDRNISALEALKGKIIFSRGSGGICGILSGQKALRCLEKFWGFLKCLERFRTYLYIFFGSRGPC